MCIRDSELSHVKNYDTLVSTLVVVLAGTIALLSDWMLRSFWWGGASRRPTRSFGASSRSGARSCRRARRPTSRRACRSSSRATVRCLLYTSDAADDLLCVDLGGRRI